MKSDFINIVFFTGAGMSAESGVPTYRGKGGIWHEYKWEEYACQNAFDNNPQIVLDFHELRRIEALKCNPHSGHFRMSEIESKKDKTYIITQNIDGMHQRAASKNVIELHGSLWRMKCQSEKIIIDDKKSGEYSSRYCKCGNVLRPDIVWFKDMLDEYTIKKATEVIINADLFISIGTSALVWPAAGYANLAKDNGAYMIEINPHNTELSTIYDKIIRKKASEGLEYLVNEGYFN